MERTAANNPILVMKEWLDDGDIQHRRKVAVQAYRKDTRESVGSPVILGPESIWYTYVDLGWGPKYTIPAYKHYNLDGVDEIQDDSNRYLVYGVNQDGEKAWYSYDYDKDSLQLFDDVAYQGEQNYITELEDQDAALRTEADYQQNRYTTDMGRRLMIILVMTLIIIILLNAVVILTLRMKKMQMLPEKEDDEEEEDHTPKSSSYVTGSLEENESDFHDPEEDELEIIDLDNASDDDED